MADRRPFTVRATAGTVPGSSSLRDQATFESAGMSRAAAEKFGVANSIGDATLIGERARMMARGMDALRRRGTGSFSVSLDIDLKKLADAFAGVDLKAHDTTLYRALNDAIEKVQTTTLINLQRWTSIKLLKRLRKGVTVKRAYSGNWTAAVIVKDNYLPITRRYFGAEQKAGSVIGKGKIGARGGPVTAFVWGRSQTFAGAFFVTKNNKFPPDTAPAFHRLGPQRKPIKPVWGPNPAREMQRHEGVVRAQLKAVADAILIPRIGHGLKQEFDRVKSKHRL